MLACSSHNSKAPNFLPLQKSQPIASGAPAQPQPRILLVNRGCHLPGLRPGRHAFIKSLMSMIQLTSPEKPLHRKWKVTRSWDSSRGGTAEGRPARGYGRPVTARGKIGLICLHLGGGGGWRGGMQRGERESGAARLLESSSHPAAGKANRRRTRAFYRVILSSSVLSIRGTVVPLTSKCLTEQLAVPCWRHAGCHWPRREIRARNSCRSGLLLPVETRTRLNVASYKFLQKRASLQHVARNVAVAMVNIHV